MKYLITGATGNTGKLIAKNLLSNGKSVRVIGRDSNKLKELADLGAEVFVGDLTDKEFTIKAFGSCDAAYCIIPPNYGAKDVRAYQNTVADNFISAIKANNTKYIVTLSSVGAHLPKGNGVVGGLYDLEQKINALEGVNVYHLRPSYFMENLFMQKDTVKNMGIFGSTINGDIEMPLVHTSDIAEVGTQILNDLNFNGSNVRYILGPKNYTMKEVSSILGSKIGLENPQYVQFPVEDARNAMLSTGFLTPSLVEGYLELQEGMNKGIIYEPKMRTPDATTKTSLEEFANTWAHVYNM